MKFFRIKTQRAQFLATMGVVVFALSFFTSFAALAEMETLEPRLLYEIRDYPDTGFFQWISSMSVDESGDAVVILGGSPAGVSFFRRGSGAPLKQTVLKALPDAGAWGRAAVCGGQTLVSQGGRVFDVSDNGEMKPSRMLPQEGAPRADMILCDRRGRLLVVNQTAPEIVRYADDGEPNMRLAIPKEPKQAARFPLRAARDVATDSFGRLYALDPKSRAVIPFDEAGRPMPSITGGIFSDIPFPWDSPAIAADSRGRIWLVNFAEDSIDAFDSFGTPVARIPRETTTGPRFISPVQLVVDSDDRLYVLDEATVSVKVFDLR